MPDYTNRRYALKVLDHCGLLYRKDFFLLLNDPSHQFSTLKKLGLIEEKKIVKQGVKKTNNEYEDIVMLTPKGHNEYLKDENEKRFEIIFNNDTYKELKKLGKRYYNTDKQSMIKRAWAFLTKQKIKVLFSKAGVATFSFEKPSLKYLWYNLSNSKQSQRLIIDENYMDYELRELELKKVKERLREQLIYGIYYTKEEVSDLISYISSDSKDSFEGIDFKGIFISNKTCLIVFISTYGENKRIQYLVAPMMQLIEKLKGAFCLEQDPITEIYRPLPCISDSNEPSRYIQHGINALVFTIGDSLVYSMATGHKHGIQKEADIVQLKNAARAKNIKISSELLDATNNTFDRIFAIQDNANGIEKLKYLTSFSIEEWYNMMKNMCSKNKHFSPNTSNVSRITPYIYNAENAPAIYMPVHEIKFYAQVFREKEKYNSIAFITEKNMMDAISHSVRKIEGLYFFESIDAINEVGEKCGINEYYLYDAFGYKAGVHIVEEYIKKNKGKKLKHNKEYANIPKMLGEDTNTIMFYNNIALKKLSVERALELAEQGGSVLEDSLKQEKVKKLIGIYLDEQEYSKFTELMKRRGITSNSELGKKLLIQALEYELKKPN